MTTANLTPENFKATAEMINACDAYVKAKAKVDTLAPIVNGYKQAVIDELKPVDEEGNPVTTVKEAYFMTDENFTVYVERINNARKAAGLVVPSDEYCPLLLAEHELSKAADALINSMTPLTHLTAQQVICRGLQKRDEFVKLILKILVPYLSR